MCDSMWIKCRTRRRHASGLQERRQRTDYILGLLAPSSAILFGTQINIHHLVHVLQVIRGSKFSEEKCDDSVIVEGQSVTNLGDIFDLKDILQN